MMMLSVRATLYDGRNITDTGGMFLKREEKDRKGKRLQQEKKKRTYKKKLALIVIRIQR